MTWPFWLVIALVVLAALITFAYVIWIQSRTDYEELKIENDSMIMIATVRLKSDTDKKEVLGGYLILYRDSNLQAPWQLEDKIEEKLGDAIDSRCTIEMATVIKEPGYNSFQV